MNLSDLLGMSLESLFKRKVRTILTIMGVVIGTTSIVVMLSLGLGMKAALMNEMESMGGLRTIEVNQMSRGDDVKDKDIENTYLTDEWVAYFENMDHVESVDPVLNVEAMIRCRNYECGFNVVGVSAAKLRTISEKIGSGALVETDGLQLIIGNQVIGYFYNSKTGKNDYWDKGILPDIDLVNDPVYIYFDTEYLNSPPDAQGYRKPKRHPVDNVAVIEGDMDSWSEYSFNIYCDIDTLKEILTKEFKGRVIPGQPRRKNGKPFKQIFYSTINVNVDSMDNVTMVQQQINDLNFQTYSNAEWLESDMNIMNIIQAVLGGIGGISLFVAAIGITNTMMMSIYERTKEIGIMKVIGCRIRDIQMLFLIEAGYIGFIGGAIGIGLSYTISYIMNKVLKLGAAMFEEGADLSIIPPWLAILAVAFSALIAMLAGFLPSIRAMKLSPLAAIRAE